jgi:ATP-binding protein involved in chromosome partitioning
MQPSRSAAVANEADVLKALEKVPGPGGVSLTACGAVSGINVTGDKAFVSISGDPARAKEWEVVRVAAERAVGEIAGVGRAIVTLTAERAPRPEPASGRQHDHGPAPAAPRRPALAAVERIRFIVAVASGKGGVGKSTTSVNLALGLAAQGWRVGLLDADVYGPSAPRLFGLHGKPMVEGGKMIPLEAFGVKVMSIGFLVDENVSMVWRGPMVSQALTQMLGEVAWGELDALVVDMPPGTGDVQLTLAQQVPLAGAVIVSTPQDLALIDARRAVTMFQKVEAPILGIIENMSYFLCPHCGGRTDIFSHGGARHDAEKLGVPFLGEVPLDAAIRETSDAGRPVVGADPQGARAAIYLNLAAKVKTLLETQTRRAGPVIVKA